MRPRRFCIGLFIASLLFACGAVDVVRAQEPLPVWNTSTAETRELNALNANLVNAYLREDVTLLRRLLDDDHVHNNVFGVALTKKQFLRDIETGVLEFDAYETREIRWHVDSHTAIATGEIRAVARRNGKTVPASDFLFTRVFIRRGQEWKVLLFHNTMMPKRANLEK